MLRDADFLKIGAAIFKFLSGAGVEASYHEEIYRMTIVDALTGAHNKRYFLEFLEREIARCARYRRPLSLLMFDIDHFKAINDKHGHLTGDYVLREMSRRLLGRVRREELLARYGGEEFAAVLPETDITGARTFGEQIRRLVGDQPFEYEGDTFPVTVSVGVAHRRGRGRRRQRVHQDRRRPPVSRQARGPQPRHRLARGAGPRFDRGRSVEGGQGDIGQATVAAFVAVIAGLAVVGVVEARLPRPRRSGAGR